MPYDSWGTSWGVAWGQSWVHGDVPPPPFVAVPDVYGGGGWAIRFKNQVDDLKAAEQRGARRDAERELRRSLEAAYRGEALAGADSAEIAAAVSDVLAPVVKLEAQRINWAPALARIDLLTSLVERLVAIFEEDAANEERDIEMLLLTIT